MYIHYYPCNLMVTTAQHYWKIQGPPWHQRWPLPWYSRPQSPLQPSPPLYIIPMLKASGTRWQTCKSPVHKIHTADIADAASIICMNTITEYAGQHMASSHIHYIYDWWKNISVKYDAEIVLTWGWQYGLGALLKLITPRGSWTGIHLYRLSKLQLNHHFVLRAS